MNLGITFPTIGPATNLTDNTTITHINGIIFSVSIYTSLLKPRSNPTIMGAIVFTEMNEIISKNHSIFFKWMSAIFWPQTWIPSWSGCIVMNYSFSLLKKRTQTNFLHPYFLSKEAFNKIPLIFSFIFNNIYGVA